MENNRKSWERPIQIIALALFIAMLLSSCSVFKPYTGTCPSNDPNFFKKPHSKHYKYQ